MCSTWFYELGAVLNVFLHDWEDGKALLWMLFSSETVGIRCISSQWYRYLELHWICIPLHRERWKLLSDGSDFSPVALNSAFIWKYRGECVMCISSLTNPCLWYRYKAFCTYFSLLVYPVKTLTNYFQKISISLTARSLE